MQVLSKDASAYYDSEESTQLEVLNEAPVEEPAEGQPAEGNEGGEGGSGGEGEGQTGEGGEGGSGGEGEGQPPEGEGGEGGNP